MIAFLIQIHSSLEMALNSVERVEEYSKLPQEAADIIEGHRPPENWPSAGEIDIRSLSIRYSPELPDVLKNINIHILPNEKVGIVGRTGKFYLSNRCR